MLKDTDTIVQTTMQEMSDNPDHIRLSKGFIYPTAMATHSLLFIGDNEGHVDETTPPVHGYKLRQTGNAHRYFDRFEAVSDYCLCPWAYVDILFDRDSGKERVEQLMASAKGREYIGFQLSFLEMLIREVTPEVIVVCSTITRTIVELDGNWLTGDSLGFDNQIGTHRWEGIPIFFSAPFSGPNALDTDSLDRLQWHIRTVLRMETERQLRATMEEKNIVVRQRRYEQATDLRDLERMLKRRVAMLSF
jgi:hypothetical protein